MPLHPMQLLHEVGLGQEGIGGHAALLQALDCHLRVPVVHGMTGHLSICMWNLRAFPMMQEGVRPNQTGLAVVAFGKAERLLMCAASTLHG